MKKNKKHITLAIVAIIIASLAFGYAYLTTTLSINGITDIDANNWDVYFDNAQVTPGSVSGAQEIEAPTITSDTEVEFHVNLKQPGDFYEFTIEARNDGTIDAMINSVSKKLNNVEVTTLPAYLKYDVTYQYGDEIEDNHILAHESLETYKIRVEYRNDINPSDLPSSAQSLTLSFGVEYVQSDENAIDIIHTAYNISDTYFSLHLRIGDNIPSGLLLYGNHQDALTAFGQPFLEKFIIKKGKLESAYIGYVINGNIYYIRGGGATYDESTDRYNYDSPYFESNKSIILSSFVNEDCEVYPESVFCENDRLNLKVQAVADGDIMVFDNEYKWGCIITREEWTGCADNYG